MMESLRIWATPYGGDAFLYIGALALASALALLVLKPRLSTLWLQRCTRLGALVALPLTFIAMDLGEQHWGVAVVAIVWAVLVAIVCQKEIQTRTTTKK